MILALFALCPVLSLFAVALVLLALPYACTRLEAPIAHEAPSDWAALEAELAEADVLAEVDAAWCDMLLVVEPMRHRIKARKPRTQAKRKAKRPYGDECPETQRTPYAPTWYEAA